MVVRLRSHGRALVLPCLLLIVVVGAAPYLVSLVDDGWPRWALLAGVAAVLLLLVLLPILGWLGRSSTITTRRIVLRRGLVVRTRQELLHSRGYDVTVRKAGLQLLFRSGDVLVNTGLEKPVVLRDVPGADLVQAALHDLMEKSANPVAEQRQREQSRPLDETIAWGRR